MKKLFSIMVAVWYLCFSTIASASGLDEFLSANNKAKKGYFKNISVYGVGEKIDDKNHSGIGFKYDSDYTDFVLEKGEDYKKSSIVQRIDIDEMFYTKLGLGYLSIEEMIEGNNKFISQFSYGAEVGYGNDRNYNVAVGYVANKLTKAGLANTTSKTIYTEAVIKQDTEIGSIDAVLAYQIAEAYDKKVSDYSVSLGYYPIDDIRMGAKYNSLDSDSNDYKILAGVNYNFEDFNNLSKGSWSPAVMLTSNVSENVSLFAEYRENISNRSLKIRDTFESQISTNEIVAKKINPEEFKKRTTAKPVPTFKSFSMLEDTVYNGTLTATSTLSLIFAKVSNPANGTVTISSNGAFTYTPNTDYFGTDSFKYSVSNGIVTVEQTVNITITDVVEADTQAPTLSSTTQTFTTTAGTALTLVTVTATDTVDGNVTVVQSGQTVDFNTVGTYNVVYTATDSANNSASITHTYTVNPVPNNAPVATNVSLDAGGGETIVHNLNANISDAEDADSALTITVVSAPTHGSLVWSGNQFTYTVSDNFGYAGPDSFTYYVTDTNSSTSTTKTVNIANIVDF